MQEQGLESALKPADPPEGYSRWTVRLLADKCVELGFLEYVSAMTINRREVFVSPKQGNFVMTKCRTLTPA